MFAIYKKEMRAYFTSPIGYVFLAAFTFFSALWFHLFNMKSANSDLSSAFIYMQVVLIVLIPVLTMRSFSEEMKNRTDQLLLSSPVKLGAIVMGKFLSALTMLLIAFLGFVFYAVVVLSYGHPNLWIIIGNFIASILLSCIFIAVGMFVSSMTENQVVAVIFSVGILLFLYFIDFAGMMLRNDHIYHLLRYVSIFQRYNDFALGIFNFSSILYYLSWMWLFLFLTVRVLEKKRWS